MGFAIPAAMAAKVVKPDIPAVAIIGDGDFLMSAHEMATCVMQNLPVIFLVLNNQGFISIRDGQEALFERQMAAEFSMVGSADEKPYSPDFLAMAKSFGIGFAERAATMADLAKVFGNALAYGGPALIEVPIARDPALAGAEASGWWDFPPTPDAASEIQADYAAGRAAQQHLGAHTDGVELKEPLGIYG